jgi:hypothetical protein
VRDTFHNRPKSRRIFRCSRMQHDVTDNAARVIAHIVVVI